MDWNKILITGIHNVMEAVVVKNKSSLVNRSVSGLVFAKGGSVRYTHNGKDTLSDGTNLVYLPSGAQYTYLADFDGTCPIINFHCNYDKCEILSFPVADIDIYKKKFEKLTEVYYNEAPQGAFHKSLSILYDIFSTLDREDSAGKGGEYSKAAVRFMAENISKPELSCEDIAAALNISVVYFRKLFMKDMGMPPMSYLRKMRMNKATELLKIPQKSVTEVALEVGYSGVYPFSRVFKRENGISPSEYAAPYKDAY